MSKQRGDTLQKNVFLREEGDAWYQRNATGEIASKEDDPVLSVVRGMELHPRSVLEIGCANGWRMQLFRNAFGCECAGIDPSRQAVTDGHSLFPDLDLRMGTADDLPFPDNRFDMLIFGFCLYLVDPSLYFRVVQEADRVLAEKGHVIIYDFLEPSSFHRKYIHHEGIKSYKMEFSRLFLAHPYYFLIHREMLRNTQYPGTPDNRVSIDIMLRDPAQAFPPSPYST